MLNYKLYRDDENGYLRPRTKILNDISGKVEKLQEYLGNENFSQYNRHGLLVFILQING